MKQLTAKSRLGDLASALDPQFNADDSVLGAVRLLAALSTKSKTAQAALGELQKAAAGALQELGFANAAKDAGDSAALADFAPVAELVDDAADDVPGADDGDINPDTAAQVADALDAIVETTKSLAAQIESFDTRLTAMEAQPGNSFGRDWDDDASSLVAAQKSADAGSMWSGSAFDFNA